MKNEKVGENKHDLIINWAYKRKSINP